MFADLEWSFSVFNKVWGFWEIKNAKGDVNYVLRGAKQDVSFD